MSDNEAPGRPPVSPRRVRAGLIAVVGIGATAGLIIALVAGGRDMLAGLARLPLGTVAAALGLNVASWFGEAVVFRSLVPPAKKRGDGRAWRRSRGVLRMIPVYVGGAFPGLVTPFGSGAIPGWVYALTGEGLSAGEAAAVVGARAMLTSAFFVSAGAVALAVVPVRASGAPGAAAAGLGALFIVLAAAAWTMARPLAVARLLERLLLSRPVVRLLGEQRATRLASSSSREAGLFSHEVRSLARERPGALALAVAGLAFSRACLLAILPVIVAGLGWRGDWAIVVGIVLAVQALSSASPTPGGSGTTEAALTAALARVAPAAAAGTAALLWRGITFYLGLVVGWAFFTRRLARGRTHAV